MINPLAQSRYSELTSDRQQFLDTAEDAAFLTLPYMMPKDGHGPGDRLHTPWQSTGAQGVHVRASRLL